MNKKKLIAILTLICFLFTLMPVVAMAENDYSSEASISAAKVEYGQEANANFWYVGADDATDAVYAYLTPNADDSSKYTLTVSGSGDTKGYEAKVGPSDSDNESTMQGNLYYWSYSTSPWGGYETSVYYAPDITKVVVNEGVTSLGSCFVYCADLSDGIELPNGITSVGNAALSGTKLVNIVFPSTLETLGNIQNAYSLQSIIFEDGAGVGETMPNLSGCTALKSIVIPEGVKTVPQSGFSGCSSLETVTFPNTLETISKWSFKNCSNLQSADLSGTALVTVGEEAFINCGLKAISWPQNSNFSIGRQAFKNSGFTSLNIPAKATIGSYAFSNCEDLETLSVENGASFTNTYQFSKCSSLKTVTWSATNIPSGCFEDCSALSDITMKNVTTVDDYAFLRCVALEKIVFPDTVTSIGVNCFSGCTSIKYVSVNSTVDTAFLPSGGSFGDIDSSGYIYMKDSEWKHGVYTVAKLADCATIFYSYYKDTVSYDCNGGKIDTEIAGTECYFAPYLQDELKDISVLCTTITNMVPTKTGYTFAGWNTATDGSGTSYASGQSIGVLTENLTTLYAQWEGVPYFINFDLNGGTGTTPGALEMKFGTKGILPTDEKFKNTGYTFVGWNKAKDGTGTGYEAGGAINLSDVGEYDTITLYAIWGTCDHKDSEAQSTCTSTAVCDLCGGTISLKDHVYNSEWSKDESNHWYACSNPDCDRVKEKEGHRYANDCDVNCDVCGYERVAGEHAYIWDSNGNGTHSGSCDCDAAITEDCVYGENGNCTVCGYAKPVEEDTTPSTSTSSGGFTGSYNYPVSTPEVDNGDVKLSDSNAVEGESVTATITPDNGYGVAEVIVTDEDGNIIPVEFIGNGQYTFVMPDGGVDIEVVCKPAITMKIGDTMLNIFGKTVVNDVAPTIGEGNRTMLPIRAIANALGADVYWDAETQKVTIVKDGKVIEVFIGKDYAFVDGERIELDAKAYIENNRTYLQLRFVTETLDAEVIWDPVTRMITIIPE